LVGLVDPADYVLAEVEEYTEKARRLIADYNPELVVIFAPDHFNGFFHDVMPCCCVGMEAHAIGDFGTPKGRLSTAPELATKLAEYCILNGVDIATSQQMQVDHAFSQPLNSLLGGIDKYPVIPIFVNSVAPPLPTFKRARALGEVVGGFCKTLNKRVLFLASGGLSHQPPVPEYATASESVRQVLLGAGKNLSKEARELRTTRTVAAAKRFVADPTSLHELAPEWDRQFLNTIATNKMSILDDVANQDVTEIACASTQETKTWVAAASAMATMGPYTPVARYYRPILEWISGFGGLSAKSSGENMERADDILVAESPGFVGNGVTSALIT